MPTRRAGGWRGVVALLAGLLALLIAVAALFWQHAGRAGLDAIVAHEFAVAPTRPGALTATWLGVTALLLDDGEQALLIDPFFSRPPLWRVATGRALQPDEAAIRRGLERAGVRQLAAVLVSHSHYDHAMDAGVVARMTGARLLGSASTANIGRGAGLSEAQIAVAVPGQAYEFGRFRLRLIESRHAGASGGRPTGDIERPLTPPAPALDYRLGGTYSIAIEHPDGALLHHGSAGYVPGALRAVRAEVVFLGVALIDELAPYLEQTADAVQARRVVPVHWDNFGRPLEAPLRAMPFAVDLPRFFRDLAQLRPQLQVQTLAPYRRVELFAGRPGALR